MSVPTVISITRACALFRRRVMVSVCIYVRVWVCVVHNCNPRAMFSVLFGSVCAWVVRVWMWMCAAVHACVTFGSTSSTTSCMDLALSISLMTAASSSSIRACFACNAAASCLSARAHGAGVPPSSITPQTHTHHSVRVSNLFLMLPLPLMALGTFTQTLSHTPRVHTPAIAPCGFAAFTFASLNMVAFKFPGFALMRDA